MMHINIRRIAKNKGKLLGFLSTLKEEFDIFILTEIGNDAEHYINKNFLPHYDAFIDTPKHNRYGGTADQKLYLRKLCLREYMDRNKDKKITNLL